MSNIQKTLVETALELAIAKFVHQMGGNLTIADKTRLTNNLTAFVTISVNKYVKGQAEHGGSITDRNLNTEIAQEIVDLWQYNWANQEKNNAS